MIGTFQNLEAVSSLHVTVIAVVATPYIGKGHTSILDLGLKGAVLPSDNGGRLSIHLQDHGSC